MSKKTKKTLIFIAIFCAIFSCWFITVEIPRHKVIVDAKKSFGILKNDLELLRLGSFGAQNGHIVLRDEFMDAELSAYSLPENEVQAIQNIKQNPKIPLKIWVISYHIQESSPFNSVVRSQGVTFDNGYESIYGGRYIVGIYYCGEKDTDGDYVYKLENGYYIIFNKYIDHRP